jgi:hypothetical protein
MKQEQTKITKEEQTTINFDGSADIQPITLETPESYIKRVSEMEEILIEGEPNLFPGDFESIWLIPQFAKRYERKADAILYLKENFKENIDYTVHPRKAIKGRGYGKPGNDYYLSVECTSILLLYNKNKQYEIRLNASSTPSEIEMYFRKVSELYDAGEDFPVNLEEVLLLFYGNKGNAVARLRRNFLENIDYKVFMTAQKNPQGGRPEEIYMLSVGCMEHLVAREVDMVFEVYRQVFHRVRKAMEQPMVDIYSVEYLEGLIQRMKENKAETTLLKSENKKMRKELDSRKEEERVPLVPHDYCDYLKAKHNIVIFPGHLRLLINRQGIAFGTWKKFQPQPHYEHYFVFAQRYINGSKRWMITPTGQDSLINLIRNKYIGKNKEFVTPRPRNNGTVPN